jgi:hypothetical protein
MAGQAWALFVDTNYFLHYPPLVDTDWLTLCGASEARLCLCITVINELDDKKSDPQLGDRARQSIREIRQTREGGGIVRERVALETLPNDLRVEDFPLGFSPESPDDAILVHALLYGQAHPHLKVAVVSEDLGMEIKCGAHGITLLKPDFQTRKQNPADDTLRKYRAAAAELASLKNQLPDLKVLADLDSGKQPDSVVRVTLKAPAPGDLNAELKRARETYPRRTAPQPRPIAAFEAFAQIPESEYQRYNQEVDSYLSLFPSFFAERENYLDLMARSFTVTIWVSNATGTVPANEIDVHLHFPDGLRIFNQGKGPKSPKRPPLPSEPRSQFDQLTSVRFPDFEAAIRPPTVRTLPSLSGPRIRKTTSYEVDYRHDSVKHGYNARIGSLLVVFDSWVSAKSFHADYVVTAANQPKHTEGQIHFAVQVANRGA